LRNNYLIVARPVVSKTPSHGFILDKASGQGIMNTEVIEKKLLEHSFKLVYLIPLHHRSTIVNMSSKGNHLEL